ncbi:glycosyltransferase family 2 protein [Sporofaciens musculi]|uniref:glycosyltransferase family 2 protein n=1 Tax=Sporofaciens musculi TaxID=2681861 RepID=UPI00258A2326|nr:glycosyltransferase [Sporofaciens musculi]
MKMGVISVVIPIYNAQRHLERCLLSITQQTFTNFECILIDDGSTDDSQGICHKYINEDSRFTYIRKDNSGVSASRNIGVQAAAGEYIAFVDADDYIEKDYLQILFSKLSKLSNPGLCLCQYFIDSTGSCFPVIEPELKSFSNIAPFFLEQNLREKDGTIYSDNIWGSVWRCLFCKKVIEENSIEFKSNLRIHEDQVFILEYINSINAKNVIYIERPLYHYTVDLNYSSALHREYITDLFVNDKYYLQYVKEIIKKADELSNVVKEQCYSNICFQNAYKIISQEQYLPIKKAMENLKYYSSSGLKEVTRIGLSSKRHDDSRKWIILKLYILNKYVSIVLLFKIKRIIKRKN